MQLLALDADLQPAEREYVSLKKESDGEDKSPSDDSGESKSEKEPESEDR